MGLLHTPTSNGCAGHEVLHPAAGEVELWPDRCLAGWPSSGFHGGHRRQAPALGARARFNRSQDACWHARREAPLLVARQPLHRLLRRRPTQEDRYLGRAGTNALRGAGDPFRRRLEPRWGDYLRADGWERAVADICDGRRSYTGDNHRHATPGDCSSLPNFSAGWSSLPLLHYERAEGDTWGLPRLARRDSQAAAARRCHGYQVYGRSPRRHDQRRRLAGLRARWRLAGPAL